MPNLRFIKDAKTRHWPNFQYSGSWMAFTTWCCVQTACFRSSHKWHDWFIVDSGEWSEPDAPSIDWKSVPRLMFQDLMLHFTKPVNFEWSETQRSCCSWSFLDELKRRSVTCVRVHWQSLREVRHFQHKHQQLTGQCLEGCRMRLFRGSCGNFQRRVCILDQMFTWITNTMMSLTRICGN